MERIKDGRTNLDGPTWCFARGKDLAIEVLSDCLEMKLEPSGLNDYVKRRIADSAAVIRNCAWKDAYPSSIALQEGFLAEIEDALSVQRYLTKG